MKKIILLALATLMMVGCRDENIKYNVKHDYNVVVIDDCEYVRYNLAYGFQHKGNCRFCAERRKQELKGLVEQLKEK